MLSRAMFMMNILHETCTQVSFLKPHLFLLLASKVHLLPLFFNL